MNTIRMTVELCPEDRERLDKILEALSRKNCDKRVEGAVRLTTSLIEESIQHPPIPEAPAPEEPAAEPQPQPEVKPVERSAVQKKVVELSAAGKKDQVREIVTAYGNAKVSDIPEDKLAEVWQKLTALEG